MSIGDFLEKTEELWLGYCRGLIAFEELIEKKNALNREFERNNDGLSI